jgi:Tfp pilus tip-associated adhesin PilY1
MAGKARIPLDPSTRNIYTFIPNGTGGGAVTAFTTANAATLTAHMGAGALTASLITAVRSLPIGAIISSTPAIMDPPSLDPPPDDEYGRPDGGTTFAGLHKDRRAMIFVGANDGMIHAIDARTGYEVWAFIPYNLLPKLRALIDGQPVEQFDYFVDSSPKIAEVKIGAEWRSLLIIGEGAGGTFYQSFDVTEAGMGVSPSSGDLAAVNSLLSHFDTPDESIQFKWSFPNYSSFDPTVRQTITGLTDGTPGGTLKLYGDLKATATYAEKTVGFTWSDPAVGSLDVNRDTTAVIVGSGYFPDVETQIPNRGASAPKAGNAMYLLDVDTGEILGNSGTSCPAIASGSGTGQGCAIIGDVAANGRKNALQADPTAAGNYGEFFVRKAYIGDVDGKYWRFSFTTAGVISVDLMLDTTQPIYASSALLFVGSSDVYMFFATGSDLLPASTSGGTGGFKMFGLKDNYPASGATQKFSNSLATVSISGGFTNGERPSTSPTVAGDIVFFTATTEDSGSPCADYTSKVYAMTYLGSSAYTEESGPQKRVVAVLAGRATAPFIVDQHLYLSTAGATGANVEALGDPEDFNNGVGQVGVRILSWREIR